MSIWLSDKDQIQVKDAFSSLWEVTTRKWDDLFDSSPEEKIKKLEIELQDLKTQLKLEKDPKEKNNDQ